MTTPYLTSNPAFAKTIAPFSQHIIDTASKYGVPADFVFMTIDEESSGNPKAIGDNGQAIGLYQVQTPYAKSWGFPDPTKRTDPIAATTLIMPEIARLFRKAGGDWGNTTVAYNRGESKLDRILKGEALGAVVLDKTGRERYRIAKELQARTNPSNVIRKVSDAYLEANKPAAAIQPAVVKPAVVKPTVVQPAVVQPSIYQPTTNTPVVVDNTVSDYVKKLQEQQVEDTLKLSRLAKVGTNPKIDFIDDLSTVDYIE